MSDDQGGHRGPRAIQAESRERRGGNDDTWGDDLVLAQLRCDERHLSPNSQDEHNRQLPIEVHRIKSHSPECITPGDA